MIKLTDEKGSQIKKSELQALAINFFGEKDDSVEEDKNELRPLEMEQNNRGMRGERGGYRGDVGFGGPRGRGEN